MRRKVKHTAAKLRAIENRVASAYDPDAAMQEIDWVTTKLPMPPRRKL